LARSPVWPARPGEAQHGWEAPRLSAVSLERVAKLKALGNAVVPAQAYPIFAAIAAQEGW
jgi:DNA (cytosine-5)-methyltransferase 1